MGRSFSSKVGLGHRTSTKKREQSYTLLPPVWMVQRQPASRMGFAIFEPGTTQMPLKVSFVPRCFQGIRLPTLLSLLHRLNPWV